MNRSRAIASALVLLTLFAANRPAAAAWPHEPNNGNVALCTAASSQYSPTIVSDGAGGAIVTWYDYRGGNYDIYAQRISAAGVPQWTANGVALCTATGEQQSPTIVSDGSGGAIVTWFDSRGGATTDIYAQRISASGVPQWTANGVALCTAANNQVIPTIASDGAGGAIVTWYDLRSSTTNDIYAQRISASGVPQWTANGVALCTAASNQLVPTIVSDGAGGAIVTWHDLRSANYDIYAQRISAAGVPQWTVNGVALCTAAGDQQNPRIASDGADGAIVTWSDYRSGVGNDIYAQRISAAGAPQWTANGVALCTVTNEQYSHTIVSDGAGGAIVAWQDLRSSLFDIYAQRIGASGVPQWTANGVALCTATNDQFSPTIASDGAGGAIVTWYDLRSGTHNDIYAQRISLAGVPQWTSNGVALCTAVNSQYTPTIVSDDAGGAIVTWYDYRSENFDIYTQRVERYGQLGNPEPSIARVRDVPNDQGGFVKVSWDASYLDADPIYGVFEYRIFRSAPNSISTRAVSRHAVTEDSDLAAREGILLARTSAGVTEYWEFVGTHAAEALAGYSRVVATTSDSVGGSNPRTLFMVEARASTSISAARWASAADSGYSVDNLPPAAPAPLTGEYAAGTTNLHWNRNAEADLAGYRLYRGTNTSFTPGSGNLMAALPDTGYADPAGAPYVYKLTAVDSHGNESPVATLVPAGTLDADNTTPSALSFAPPSPNPARGATTLDYTLSRAGHVRLSVYDPAGRRVQVLRDSELPAGAHRESFTLRDEAGLNLASGLYLVRLEAEGRLLTRRLAAIR